jgi:hypothetical protein
MKQSFSLAHFLPTGALVMSLLLGAGTACAQSTSPARTYHVDQYGRETKVVKERWSENANGQKHGIYISYYTNGAPFNKFTYVNGIKNGPAFETGSGIWGDSRLIGVYVNNKRQGTWDVYDLSGGGVVGSLRSKKQYNADILIKETVYKYDKISETYTYSNRDKNGPAKVYGSSELEYASGTYTNDKPSGTWLNAANSSEVIRYKKGYKLMFADGKAISATDAFGKPVALVSESEIAKHLADTKAQQEDAKRRTALDPDFFVSDQNLRHAFLADQFNGVDGAALTGAEIIKAGILKDERVIDLLEKNPQKTAVILKVSGMELGKSPIKLLLSSAKLNTGLAEDIIHLHSTQICGEMLYWVLRGVGDQKEVDNTPVAKSIISAIGNNNSVYKSIVENRFNEVALVQKQYDPKEYPLRRWLYEAYKNDRPYLWMNKLTADTGDDAKYPERPN